jgi:hypothetical protein
VKDLRKPLGPSGQVATYVFCLVQSRRAPSMRGVPDSLPGAGAPRAIPVDRDVWAVVADAPLNRFSEKELEKNLQDLEAVSRHAMAHASVIEFLFRRWPVIPLKLFTLFSSDDRARQSLYSRRSTLRRLFAQLRGLEEWAVRIVAGEAEAQSARRTRSGRDYLETKKRLTEQSSAPPRSIVRDINAAMKRLGKLAARSRQEKLPPSGPGRRFVIGASFLVRANRRRQWECQIKILASELDRRGHALEVTGPWPPYHFVSK